MELMESVNRKGVMWFVRSDSSNVRGSSQMFIAWCMFRFFFSQPVLLASMCRNDMPGGRFKQNIDRSINYKFANVECHGPTSDV